MFSQCAVVRDEWDVEAEFESDGPRITKAASGDERDVHTLFACVFNREAIALGDISTRIEQSPVQIESQKSYAHKEKNKVKELRSERKSGHKEAQKAHD